MYTVVSCLLHIEHKKYFKKERVLKFYSRDFIFTRKNENKMFKSLPEDFVLLHYRGKFSSTCGLTAGWHYFIRSQTGK